FLRRARDAPGRDCNAVIGKQLLRLVFVEIHVGSVRGKTGRPWAGPRAAVAAGSGSRRGGRARHSRRSAGRGQNRPGRRDGEAWNAASGGGHQALLPPAGEGWATIVFPRPAARLLPGRGKGRVRYSLFL